MDTNRSGGGTNFQRKDEGTPTEFLYCVSGQMTCPETIRRVMVSIRKASLKFSLAQGTAKAAEFVLHRKRWMEENKKIPNESSMPGQLPLEIVENPKLLPTEK